MAGADPIELIVLDIDGVLTEGETKALDLNLFQFLAEMNRAARSDGTHPAVTICSGRPAPYVEAVLQGIDAHLPGVFENGAGLYNPDGYRFLPHPALSAGPDLVEVAEIIKQTLVKSGDVVIQPGKAYTLSLFATDPEETHKLLEMTIAALGPQRAGVDLMYSSSCLNVLPLDMHKGRGIEFLAEQTGIHPLAMLGVGDSDIDLPFLARVGAAAAPANANEAVKAQVGYVSSKSYGKGVRDILHHFGVAR